MREVAAFVVCVVCLPACGDLRRPERLRFPDRSLETVERVAAAIDVKLARLETRTGSFTVGEATSQYTAWFDVGELRKIEERLSLGEYGSSRISYYFNNRSLFFYRELAERSGMGQVGSGPAGRLERAFSYDSIGQLVESRKLADGQSSPVEDWELMSIRNHTAELKRELAR